MSLTQTIRTINGEGQPRLIVTRAQNAWESFGATTYTATSVTEALGAASAITSSTAATDRISQTAHGFSIGDRIRIAGHSGSTPDLNGDWPVTEVHDANTYEIGVDITTGGTGGTARRIPDFSNIRAGMRVVGGVTRSGFATKIVYGRITAVDRDNFILTIGAGWVGGTPDNGNAYQVNGNVIDLPYCFELTEFFGPVQLLHELWKGRVEMAEWYGWSYRATLDYSRHMRADALLAMRPALNRQQGDGLILVPRIDKPQYNFGVVYDGEVALSRYGISGGHRKVVLAFRGTGLLASWPMATGGWGYGWGGPYGLNSD